MALGDMRRMTIMMNAYALLAIYTFDEFLKILISFYIALGFDDAPGML